MTPHAAIAVVLAAALTCTAAVAQAPGKPKAAPAVAPPTPGELRLKFAQCGVEAQRNAKLYALRAHGIRVLRTADRAQTRAVNALDGLFAELRAALAARPDLLTHLDAAEDASTSLTELTVQEPVVSQIRAAEQIAEQTATACAKAQSALTGATEARTQASEAIARLQMLSQRIARTYLAAPLTRTPDATQQQSLRADAAAFEQELATLRGTASADPALREHLLLVDSHWVFYRSGLGRSRDTREGLEYVGRVSEHLYETFEDELARRRRKP